MKMKVLCVFGKHQYGDASRGIGTEYATFVPALERLGYEVVHFDSWELNLYPSYAELNQALLATVEKERPDVMLTVQMHYELWLETLQTIQTRGDVATISWTTDDSWKYREVSRFIGSAYHAMTTTYADCLPQYHQDGIKNVLLTQWAVSSDALKEPLPAHACRYQVSFVGAAHGDRIQKIAKLAEYGVDVSCFGYGWPNGSVDAEDIPKIIRESVVSLNFANGFKGANQIKARTFEVPGAGGFLLTDNASGLERLYIADQEIAVFDSIEDLADKIKHFLSHPEERDRIAQAGFLRTKQEHTYDLRMQEVVNFAIVSRDRWVKESHPSNNISIAQSVSKHHLTSTLKSSRAALLFICSLIFGKKRSTISARRISFEISWRILGRKTYMADGWVGRMFPYD
jgi:spore maturation protein CgeB